MALSVEVFSTGYEPIDPGPDWDPRVAATWPASTATLIAGERDAVLVDALTTLDQGRQLASWIAAKGKDVRRIAVTHGHGDHFFGAGPVLQAFPAARLLALTDDVIAEAAAHLQPGIVENWIGWFGERFDRAAAVPVKAHSPSLDVEGTTVNWIAVGGADGTPATVIHLPDTATVCVGDAVYNDIHMWLWNSTPDSRAAWLATIDAIAALAPTTLIAGHRHPGAPDDDATRQLGQSRRYVEDFDRLTGHASTPAEIVEGMLERYPSFGNPYTLVVSAYSQFG